MKWDNISKWVSVIFVIIFSAQPLFNSTGHEEVHYILADKDGSLYVSGTASNFFDLDFLASYNEQGTKNWYKLVSGRIYPDKNGGTLLVREGRNGLVDIARVTSNGRFTTKASLRLCNHWKWGSYSFTSKGKIQVLRNFFEYPHYPQTTKTNGTEIVEQTVAERTRGTVDIFLADYDANGAFLRCQKAGTIDLNTFQNEFVFNRSVVDEYDNLYVTGYDDGGSYLGRSIWFFKFSKGKQVWVRKIGVKGTYQVTHDLTVLKDGRIWFTGSIIDREANGSSDLLVGRYQPENDQFTLFRVRRKMEEHEIAGYKEYVYIAGTSAVKNPLGGNNLTVLKLDQQGRLLWSRSVRTNYHDTFGDLAAGPHGEVYLAGNSENGYFIAKYDQQGRLLWRKTYINMVNKFMCFLTLILGFAALYGLVFGIYKIHGLVHQDRKQE